MTKLIVTGQEPIQVRPESFSEHVPYFNVGADYDKCITAGAALNGTAPTFLCFSKWGHEFVMASFSDTAYGYRADSVEKTAKAWLKENEEAYPVQMRLSYVFALSKTAAHWEQERSELAEKLAAAEAKLAKVQGYADAYLNRIELGHDNGATSFEAWYALQVAQEAAAAARAAELADE